MNQPFSAAQIPRYSALRMPYKFHGNVDTFPKWFVVIAHVNNHAICIKTTSNTEIYEHDKNRMAGCVFYKAGDVHCFPVDTAIQPDNQHGIPHALIEQGHTAGAVKIATLPANFQERLKQAVKDSDSLSGRERARIAAILA